MAIGKNAKSQQASEFWSHIESIANQVYRERPQYREDVARDSSATSTESRLNSSNDSSSTRRGDEG
jgi:hypothetical protein